MGVAAGLAWRGGQAGPVELHRGVADEARRLADGRAVEAVGLVQDSRAGEERLDEREVPQVAAQGVLQRVGDGQAVVVDLVEQEDNGEDALGRCAGENVKD